MKIKQRRSVAFQLLKHLQTKGTTARPECLDILDEFVGVGHAKATFSTMHAAGLIAQGYGISSPGRDYLAAWEARFIGDLLRIVILKFLDEEGFASAEQIQEHAKAKGFSPASASREIKNLVQVGRVTPLQVEITDAGLEAIKEVEAEG